MESTLFLFLKQYYYYFYPSLHIFQYATVFKPQIGIINNNPSKISKYEVYVYKKHPKNKYSANPIERARSNSIYTHMCMCISKYM